MVEHLTYIIGLLILWFVLSNVMMLYRMFHAPRCPAGAKDVDCLNPMFASGESIDLYIYLTTTPSLKWWTESGFEELLKAPFWNATAFDFGQPMEPVSVEVPLSLASLGGVRRNESTLYAHCFLARGGSKLKDVIRHSGSLQGKAPQRGVLGDDVLHTSARLTRRLPNSRRTRRNLLGNSTAPSEDQSDVDAEGGMGSNASSSSDDVPPIRVALPLLERTIPVYPEDALMWVGSTFLATAFLEPSVPAAAARGGLAAGAAPWLLQLRARQAEKRRLLKRQRAQESKLWLLEPTQVVPHLVPLVRVALSVDDQSYDARHAPPLLYREMVFQDGSPMPVGEREVRYFVAGQRERRYAPPLTIDTSGIQQRAWRPLDANASRPDPAVALEIDVSGMVRYSLVQTMKQSLEMYMRVGFSERDLEELKDFFFRYPIHIMIIMQVIGFLQMTLTTLAFKNDISFFRGRSDYTGLSSRSLATDTLQEIIIFLYLFDYDDISRIVLFQVGTSAVISAWKYARVARLGLYWSYFLPWISYNRGSGDNGDEKSTEDIDARGMRYLKFVLYPLSAVWGVYNLYHYSYKSWWSWLVSSLADLAYTFGFINMMPQIFINYKLKSVAHMPWRVLMYKFFNTFIDDVFAFFIMTDYMTKKHRFMTLRDDVVFFVFLYQRHIYKVDPNRPDEFGFVYADAKAKAQAEEVADSKDARGQQPSIKDDLPDTTGNKDSRDLCSAPEAEGEGGDTASAPTPLEGDQANDLRSRDDAQEQVKPVACEDENSGTKSEAKTRETGVTSGQCLQRKPHQNPVD